MYIHTDIHTASIYMLPLTSREQSKSFAFHLTEAIISCRWRRRARDRRSAKTGEEMAASSALTTGFAVRHAGNGGEIEEGLCTK